MLSNLFFTLLKINFMATCVAIVVLIFKYILKKLGAPRKILFLLWIIIALRFVNPVFFESNLSLFNLYSPFSIEQTGNQQTDVLTNHDTNFNFTRNQNNDFENENANSIFPTTIEEIAQNQNMPNYIEKETQTNQTTNRQIQPFNSAKNLTNTTGQKEINLFNVSIILMVVWIFGTIGMIAYSLFSYVKLKRSVMFAIKGKENYYETDMIPTPCVVGIIRPQIYLTPNVNEDDKKYILTHESVHIKRKDYLWKVVAFFILSVHWVNPFVHLFFKLFVDDMEMLCDEETVKILGEDEKEGYMASLINLSSKKMNNLVPCPIAFSDNNTERRVKNMIHSKKSGIAISIVAIVICIVIACICLTNRKENSQTSNNEINHGEENQVVEVEKQLQVIIDNVELWKNDFELDGVGYAITDLDFNGRLEIISASYGGTGGYTYNRIFEVNEKFDGLNLCESNLIEGDSDVDIVGSDFDTYYDAENNTYHYVLNDWIKVSATEYLDSKRDFILKDGKITEKYLAMRDAVYSDVGEAYTEPRISYALPNGEGIGESNYDNIGKITFSGYENRLLKIEWITNNENDLKNISKEKLYELLNDSYEKYGFYPVVRGITIEKAEWNEEERERMYYYEKALRDLYYNGELIDGTKVADSEADIQYDKFAICDVDNDGIDELIISHNPQVIAGMMKLIYEYDAQNHEWKNELTETPYITFYDNGILMADWSHNHGYAGDKLWPYNLYRYNEKEDSYEIISQVDAWDKSLAERQFDGTLFPDDIDKNNDGLVYLISLGDGGVEEYYDNDEYDTWLTSYIGNAKEVKMAFQNLTGENIEYATRYGATKFKFTDTNESNVVNEETFTSFNGFEIQITNVIEKKMEKYEYADGSFTIQYPIYVCSPDSKIKIVNAGAREASVISKNSAAFGMVKDDINYIRIFTSMENQYINTKDVDDIYTLEGGIGVVGFEIASN